jgi:hypothetical protein
MHEAWGRQCSKGKMSSDSRKGVSWLTSTLHFILANLGGSSKTAQMEKENAELSLT